LRTGQNAVSGEVGLLKIVPHKYRKLCSCWIVKKSESPAVADMAGDGGMVSASNNSPEPAGKPS
jgi:hypothetical protein